MLNASNFKRSIQKVQGKYFQKSSYEFVVRMVDWNTLLRTEDAQAKVQRVTVREPCQGQTDSYRNVFNETVVDILFYLSKQFRQRILQRVTDEARKHFFELSNNGENKRFKGKVSIVGHSLGSVISYDLLTRQWPLPSGVNEVLTKHEAPFDEIKEESPVKRKSHHMFQDVLAQSVIEEELSDESHEADKTLQLGFEINHFFLLGSPLGLFVSVYNEDQHFINSQIGLPTTKSLFNLFHPQDLIAYRIEPLI